jgi:hypothetical protein
MERNARSPRSKREESQNSLATKSVYGDAGADSSTALSFACNDSRPVLFHAPMGTPEGGKPAFTLSHSHAGDQVVAVSGVLHCIRASDPTHYRSTSPSHGLRRSRIPDPINPILLEQTVETHPPANTGMRGKEVDVSEIDRLPDLNASADPPLGSFLRPITSIPQRFSLPLYLTGPPPFHLRNHFYLVGSVSSIAPTVTTLLLFC